jgi:hypothetical protein
MTSKAPWKFNFSDMVVSDADGYDVAYPLEVDDGKLMASAPDLLAACELLIRGRDSEATIAAERAVRKARGE